MPGFDMRMSVNGLQQVQLRLGTYEKTLGDLKPEFTAVKVGLQDMMEKRFEGEGGESKWQTLSTPYFNRKQQTHPGKKILQLTGQMKGSLTDQLRHAYQPHRAVFWSDDPVAYLHDTGAGRLPIRRIGELAADDQNRIVQIVRMSLAARGAGR
jgi:phage gpG-like protein